MDIDSQLAGLCSRLAADSTIRENLIAVIWIGSRSRAQDVHEESDLDIQIVMNRPQAEVMLALSGILPDYPLIDLSVVYLKDVFTTEGGLDFQDGTKGPFFIPVLADGVVLYGRNIYAPIVGTLSIDDLRPSIMFTIREYLARLRIMTVQGDAKSFAFKKYSLKLFKDVLVYTETLHLRDMTAATNEKVLSMIDEKWKFREPAASALRTMADYSTPDTRDRQAALLDEYERIVEAISQHYRNTR